MTPPIPQYFQDHHKNWQGLSIYNLDDSRQLIATTLKTFERELITQAIVKTNGIQSPNDYNQLLIIAKNSRLTEYYVKNQHSSIAWADLIHRVNKFYNISEHVNYDHNDDNFF